MIGYLAVIYGSNPQFVRHGSLYVSRHHQPKRKKQLLVEKLEGPFTEDGKKAEELIMVKIRKDKEANIKAPQELEKIKKNFS